MSIQAEPFGMNFTVADLKATAAFYGEIYAPDNLLEGAFAGIPYISVMRNGEVLACAFQKGEGNPLADSFPTIKVESVAAYQEKVKALGGNVLIPEHSCPCTHMPFAICQDINGNQFMIKQPRLQ
jgi:predicted enzyme related to lactoylglutathione lyase